MTRLLKRLVLALLLVGGLTTGCASQKASQSHDWQTYEPPGGWANYLPPTRDYKPSAARATAFGITPDVSTLSMQPGGLVMPTMGN
jgi:hypothetical protein